MTSDLSEVNLHIPDVGMVYGITVNIFISNSSNTVAALKLIGKLSSGPDNRKVS